MPTCSQRVRLMIVCARAVKRLQLSFWQERKVTDLFIPIHPGLFAHHGSITHCYQEIFWSWLQGGSLNFHNISHLCCSKSFKIFAATISILSLRLREILVFCKNNRNLAKLIGAMHTYCFAITFILNMYLWLNVVVLSLNPYPSNFIA